MIDLDKVRAALPMPELMVKLGVGDNAHAKAICPGMTTRIVASASSRKKGAGGGGSIPAGNEFV
jgi:hypothetical protein